MWIYPANPEATEEQLQPKVLMSTDTPIVNSPAKKPECSTKMEPRPYAASKMLIGGSKLSNSHWLMALAFLIGTSMAGVLRVQSDLAESNILTYYLEQWSSVFSIQAPQSAVALFGEEYLTLCMIASILLLLGFSAFGPALIYLVMMLYGLGSGTLLLWGYADLRLPKAFFFFILSALPAAVSEGWLCVLASASLQASNKLKKYAFAKSSGTSSVSRNIQGSTVLGYYALTIFLMLPLCGMSTGLAYLNCLC